MSITKSYNRHTDTYYAYETNYVWDEKLQKKVQKKHCIGQYDPETGEVIPNGKVGRPSKPRTNKKTGSIQDQRNFAARFPRELSRISSRLDDTENTLRSLLKEIAGIKSEINRLYDMHLSTLHPADVK